MKRIMAVLLCIAMLAAVQVTAYPADDSSVSARRENNIDIFFDAFPVITDEITEDGRVTRGEFAYIITNILERSGIKLFAGVDFADVTAETPYAAEISAAAEMGYMSDTTGTGRFRPDDVISDVEAAACMVHMLNCDYIVNLSPSYNAGVWKAADEAGIDISGFTGGNNAVWIKELVFESLRANIGIEQGIENGFMTMTLDRDNTYISKYWNMTEISGLLSKSPVLDITGKDPAADNTVFIGDVRYMSYLIYENTAYLGMNVTAYVSDPGETGGRVLCMYPSEQYNPAVIINGRDIDNIKDLSTIKVVGENGRTKSYSVSALAHVYYNFDYMGPVRAMNYSDSRVADMLEAINNGRSCQIILTENNNDSRYDFVWVRVYENYSVSSFSYNDYTIQDKYGTKLEFENAFKSNNVVLFDENNGHADATDIEERDILSLIISESETGVDRVVGYLSKSTVSGIISQVSGDENIINDIKYYVCERYVQLSDENNKNVLELKPGLRTTFYLNCFSEIAAVSLTDYYREGVAYAFIIGIYYEQNEQETSVKYLNEEGIMCTEELPDKLVINGAAYKYEQIIEACSEITGEIINNGVCEVYKPARITHSSDKITVIELAYSRVRQNGSSSDRLYPDVILYSRGENTDGSEVTLADVVYKNNTFGKRVGLTSSSVVFDVPLRSPGAKAVKDSDAYTTTSVSNMMDDCVLGIGGQKKVGDTANGAYMEFYDADSTLFASAAVRYYKYDPDKGGLASPPEMLADCIIVTDVINDAINEDGDRIKIIKGYKGGTEIEMSTAPIRDLSNSWGQFSTLTDSTNGAILEKRDKSTITPSQIKETGLLPGDVIQVTTNSKNEITNMLINIRGGDAANVAWLMPNGNGTTTSILSAGAGHGNEYLGVNYGRVEEIQNGKVVLYELDGKRRVYSIGSPTITVYNRDAIEKARKGGTGDIAVGKEIYIRQYYSQIKEIVVFE